MKPSGRQRGQKWDVCPERWHEKHTLVGDASDVWRGPGFRSTPARTRSAPTTPSANHPFTKSPRRWTLMRGFLTGPAQGNTESEAANDEGERTKARASTKQTRDERTENIDTHNRGDRAPGR